MATEVETPEEQKAREEAQARRQRILDGASTRMDVVEGAVPKPEGETKGSSKLAAMRRRRFKKKSDVVPEEKTQDEEPKVETSVAPEEPKAPPIQQAEENAPVAPPVAVNSQDCTKKKYMGVAKMRRMKLKEKQQQESEEDASTAVLLPHKKIRRTTAPRYPILMHIVTVVLLFLAGLDIGLQQVGIDYQDYEKDVAASVLDIHTELAPRRLGGISFLVSKLSKEEVFIRGGDMKEKLLIEPVVTSQSGDDPDEFEVAGSDDDKKEAMIDPLFGVDLDKMTAGPGPILLVARQAVKFHRMLLGIFYYGPIRFSQWLISCSTNPPIFCVFAIILRQLVGKIILGANIKEIKEDEEQHKDIMNMVKTFVTKFLFSAFPTAVSLYDMWVHLRADMYVVLCGFFVGLAVSHTPVITSGSLLAGYWPQSTGTADEL